MVRCRLEVLMARPLGRVSRGSTGWVTHCLHMLWPIIGWADHAIGLLPLLLAMVLSTLGAMQGRFLLH